MKKRVLTFTACFIFSLTLLWSIMFATDYVRCNLLMQPLFAVGSSNTLADDGKSGTYQGLGYTVEVEGQLSAELGYIVKSVEMSAFGKVIAASIS